jgi:hypothetical protein
VKFETKLEIDLLYLRAHELFKDSMARGTYGMRAPQNGHAA